MDRLCSVFGCKKRRYPQLSSGMIRAKTGRMNFRSLDNSPIKVSDPQGAARIEGYESVPESSRAVCGE